MLRSLLLSALFASAALAQPMSSFSGGGAVLPQNFQQPIAAQLTQPVLTSQQAMQLIPNDQLQAQLNQRVLQAGTTGVLPPINYHAVGVYGAGGAPLQQQQQPIMTQQPLAGIGGGFQQRPVGIGGVGIQQQQQQLQPQLGLGAIGIQQQQPFVGGVGIQQQPAFGGVGIQQQPGFGGIGVQQLQQQPGFGGVGIAQAQPWAQSLGVGAGVLPQQQLGVGGFQQQMPLGMGVGVQQQMPLGMGVGVQQQQPFGIPQQQQLGLGGIGQQQLGVLGGIPQQQQLGLGAIPQQQWVGIGQQGMMQQQQPMALGLGGIGGIGGAPQMMGPM